MAFSVIFAGTPQFAVPSLEALVANPAFDVTYVITQPDKPVGRKKTMTPPPVKTTAEKLGIRVWQPENINAEWNDTPIADLKPDFLIVVAYGQILKNPVLTFPKIAPINVHASLLPRWRGASPIQQAIMTGDTETGITVQRMAEKLDTGPVLSQRSLPLEQRETFVTLHDKLSAMGALLLTETLAMPLTETVQDETQKTLCKKLSRVSGMANASNMSAVEIDRLVRALNPWPGVRMELSGESVKILETCLEPDERGLAVPCNDSILYVLTIQPEGRTPMNAKDWSRGKR